MKRETDKKSFGEQVQKFEETCNKLIALVDKKDRKLAEAYIRLICAINTSIFLEQTK